jgi:tetratricopeptide (TPR) repeat protein
MRMCAAHWTRWEQNRVRRSLHRRIKLGYLVVVLALVIGAAGDELGTLTISGFVRDAEGKAVAGAKVILTNEDPPPVSIQTASGAAGEYQFNALRPGRYQLTTELSGFAPSKPVNVVVGPSAPAQKVDLSLTRVRSDPAAKTSSDARPPLKFEAAGVRGLIDPGGYSAPANAAAASGLVQGIADIKRAGNGSDSAAGNWPCGLEPELRKAAAATPDNAEANRRMGQFYVAHGQPAKAIPFLERARQLNPQEPATGRDLALAWLGTGQFDAARDLLNFQAKQESSAEVHRLLARAEEGSGMFQEASREYQLAAKLEPAEENLFGVGYELILAGLPQEAARAFEAGLQPFPRSGTLLIGFGTAQFLEGRSAEAVHSFLQAADLNPADPGPYPFLAGTFGISGAEIDRVRGSFKRYLELAPDNAEASYFYALTLSYGSARSSDGADLSSAEALLKRALVLDPKLAKAHFQLGTLYAQRGAYQNAVTEYEDTIRLAPDLREAHYRLAGAYRQTGRNELAAREMKLFEDMRAQETSDREDARISIEQFLSVINRPGDRPGHNSQPQAECPNAAGLRE